MKSYHCPSRVCLAAGLLLLALTPTFGQTYHPHYLDQADDSGRIAPYVSVNPSGSGFVDAPFDQPSTGSNAAYYAANTVGSWALSANTTVTIHADEIFGPSLSVANLDGFSFDYWGGTWTLTIETSAGTLSAVTDPSLSNWFSIGSSSFNLIFAGPGGFDGTWAAVQASEIYGNALISHILISGFSDQKIANLSLTSDGDTQVVVFAAIPEPGSIVMLLAGAGALFFIRRRRMTTSRSF